MDPKYNNKTLGKYNILKERFIDYIDRDLFDKRDNATEEEHFNYCSKCLAFWVIESVKDDKTDTLNTALYVDSREAIKKTIFDTHTKEDEEKIYKKVEELVYLDIDKDKDSLKVFLALMK